MDDWYTYDNLKSRWPYDWAPATKGGRPWDQLDFHLDLGAGRVPKGRIGVDKRFSEGKTDLVINLETLMPAYEEGGYAVHHGTEEHYKELPGAHGSIFSCLPFPDETIESIISSHALEHIGPGFERLMEECYRVLKWGGVMRIVVPLFPSYTAVSEYDHKRWFMEKTLMGFCQESRESYTDGFSERYNTCCFRMIDEDMTEPTDPEKMWTPEDARELRTTLWKGQPDEEEPRPSDFIPKGTDADEGDIQEGQGDAVQGNDAHRRATETGGSHDRSGDEEALGSLDGDPPHGEGGEPGVDVLAPERPSRSPRSAQTASGKNFASVCVLSYERLGLLKECIGSMLAHAEAPFELIVHDDGSIDPALREWLVRMSNEGVVSTLLMNSTGWNEGQGIAMNRMAAVAKGDPIIKCDQDLLFKPGWLRRVNEVLRDNYDSQKMDCEEPLIGALGLFKYPVDPVDHREMHIHDWRMFDEVKDFVGSLMVMPRQAWEIFGPWEERSPAFAEDNTFKLEVAASEGWCCALTKEDLATNQGFGVGPSTVVVAPDTVQEIKRSPKVLTTGV